MQLQRHEYVAVAWSFAYFFCVLSSYYVLRPVRDAMAIVSGTDTLPYLFLATFFTMLLATLVFGWLVSRYSRRVFLPWVYLFFISNILIFWVVFSQYTDSSREWLWLSRIFFVWSSVFNLFAVSVFWSFMADIYSREQGRRLFGPIASGGSIGALLGAVLTSVLVVRIGFQSFLPVAAALLCVAIFCIGQLRKWAAFEQENESSNSASSEEPLGGNPFNGITRVFSSKYFSGIASSSIIATLLGTVLYTFTAILVEDAIPNTNEQVRFFSNINIASNAIALIAQMIVVKQVVARFGIGVSLSLLPIVSVASFVLLAVDPVLGTIAAITVVRRGLGFGFAKPTTDMLYSVATQEEKYKTKNFIDTVVFRAGDVIGASSAKFMMVLGISGVSWVMLPFAMVWTGISLWLGRDYRRQARELKNRGIV